MMTTTETLLDDIEWRMPKDIYCNDEQWPLYLEKATEMVESGERNVKRIVDASAKFARSWEVV